jgi:hypothetical protein
MIPAATDTCPYAPIKHNPQGSSRIHDADIKPIDLESDFINVADSDPNPDLNLDPNYETQFDLEM